MFSFSLVSNEIITIIRITSIACRLLLLCASIQISFWINWLHCASPLNRPSSSIVKCVTKWFIKWNGTQLDVILLSRTIQCRTSWIVIPKAPQTVTKHPSFVITSQSLAFLTSCCLRTFEILRSTSSLHSSVQTERDKQLTPILSIQIPRSLTNPPSSTLASIPHQRETWNYNLHTTGDVQPTADRIYTGDSSLSTDSSTKSGHLHCTSDPGRLYNSLARPGTSAVCHSTRAPPRNNILGRKSHHSDK